MKNILKFEDLSPKKSVPIEQEIKWKGYGEDLLFGFIYLSKKYNNFSFPIEKINQPNQIMWKIVVSYRCLSKKYDSKMKLIFPSSEKNYFKQIENYILEFNNSNSIKTNLTKKQKLNKKSISKKIINKKSNSKKIIKNNLKPKKLDKKRFVLMPIYLGSEDCDVSKGHFNIMIFDILNKTIERFEPYGSSLKQSEHKLFDKLLEKTFNKYLIKYGKIKVIVPDLLMNKKSFQTIEEDEVEQGISNRRLSDPGGFCGVWGIWFINLRLKFPNLETKILLQKAEKLIKNKYNFRKFIRNYSQFLIQERKKMLGGKSIQDLDDFQLSKKIIKLIK